MAQLIQAGEFVGLGERMTAAALEKELPPRWKVICNKLFVAPSGASREIDFIVIADHCVFVIDEKHWWGPIIGNENGWTLSDGSSRPSPITNVEMVARPVVTVLRTKIARLDDRVRGKFVHARIILSAENSSLSLDDPRAKTQVLPIAEAAARLIADDRGHPPSASIEHFRNAILEKLIALRDRPNVPQKINDYEIVESLPPVAGSRSFRGVHPDGGERVLRVIELTATEVSGASAARRDCPSQGIQRVATPRGYWTCTKGGPVFLMERRGVSRHTHALAGRRDAALGCLDCWATWRTGCPRESRRKHSPPSRRYI